jgi:NADH dehydrogenase FAD-containing subunit
MAGRNVFVLGGNLQPDRSVHCQARSRRRRDVRVVSKADRFLFIPSLIWIASGKCRPKDIVFSLAHMFRVSWFGLHPSEGIEDRLIDQTVQTSGSDYGCDYRLVATGYPNDFTVLPGLGPDRHAYSITYLDGASRCRGRVNEVPKRCRARSGGRRPRVQRVSARPLSFC